MSALDQASGKGGCYIVPNENGKLVCETHKQALLYAYVKDGVVLVRCQVGADMRPVSPAVKLAVTTDALHDLLVTYDIRKFYTIDGKRLRAPDMLERFWDYLWKLWAGKFSPHFGNEYKEEL